MPVIAKSNDAPRTDFIPAFQRIANALKRDKMNAPVERQGGRRLKGFIAMFKLNVDEALSGAKLLGLRKSVESGQLASAVARTAPVFGLVRHRRKS
jgi:hypothetical protein